MAEVLYSAPVAQLLTLGEPDYGEWLDYPGMGLEAKHIPELIGMVSDIDLNLMESDASEVWAPVHAWRALAQLEAGEAVGPLLELAAKLKDDDWILGDLPQVLGRIGAPAIAPIAAFIADEFNPTVPVNAAAESLGRIGLKHPELREECIAVLRRELERFDENDPELNGFLILSLTELKATESLPLIEEAFNAEAVDELVTDWEETQIEFGLMEAEDFLPLDSDDPFAYREPYPPFFEPEPYAVPFQPLSPKAAQKKKARLKQAKLSRKINRKKKK